MKNEGIKAEDLFKLKSLTDPQLSPEGSSVLYVQTGIDVNKDTYASHLFMHSLASKETVQWTFGTYRDTSPRWSPDGKQIAFLSDRTGKNQVYLISSKGGEAQQLTTFPNGASTLLWSPCSGKLLVSAGLKHGETLQSKPEEPKPIEPQRYDRLKYKWDGRGYFEGIYQQLAIIDVSSGNSLLLTEGSKDHSPTAWSPDGQYIAYMSGVGQQSEDEQYSDIYIMNLETKHSEKITGSTGYFRDAKWSPDGSYLSFLGHNKEFKGATLSKIWLYSFSNKTITCITESWDVELGNSGIGDFQIGAVDPGLLWTSDSNGFYFLISDYGNTGVYYGSTEGAMYPSILEPQHIYGLTLNPKTHQAVVAISTPVSPGELYSYNLTNGDHTQITSANEALLKNKTLSHAEPLSYTSADGVTVHGWLMKPVNYNEGEKYPLLLEIHGGPHMMYANSYMHEFQVLANEGYAILFTNPRGSVGYGQEFVNACRGDYGGMDYQDLMAGVDHVLENFSYIDENKLGVTGGSYGGFMTNWIIGHTDRFKAAVSQRCISNWLSFYGVSDIGHYFTEWEIMGDIFSDPETLWNHSPLKYASNVNTPLLLLHGEKDYRCPIEQSEQIFTALKRQKKEAVLVSFPGENHEVSRSGVPKMRLRHITEIRDWFNEHL